MLRHLLALVLLLAPAAASAQAFNCGAVLQGRVRLTADVVCPTFVSGLHVGADFTRIELNGFSIIGGQQYGWLIAGPVGIESNGYDNVEIVGPGTIRNFPIPIKIVGGHEHRISDLTALSSLGVQVQLEGVSKSVVERNTLHAISILAYSSPARDNLVANNTIGGQVGWGMGSVAIGGAGASGNEVSGNTILGRPTGAVMIHSGASGNAIRGNKIFASPVVLDGASDNVVEGNSIEVDAAEPAVVSIRAGSQPLHAGAAERNVVRGNRIAGAQLGIAVTGAVGLPSRDNLITLNEIVDSVVAGISLENLTSSNDARGNKYRNIPTAVIDQGAGNLWP